MSNYHVLELNEKGDTARVVFHVPTPAGTNAAGKTFSSALKEYLEARVPQGEVRIISQVPWLEAEHSTEYADITNGIIYEHMETVEFAINLSDAEKAAIVDERWTHLAGFIPGRIRERLRFWGYDRDVP